MNEQEWLDAFIKRAGFTYGWMNLESWARRMAERAYEERNAAYIEGQKAMRESAACFCDEAEDLEDDLRDVADWCAESIRALPIDGE